MTVDPVLRLAPPAELAVVLQRRAHRRHLAATLLDLAARGHLHISDAGNDPTIGFALDWYLLLPGEAAPVGVDATDSAAVAVAHPRPATGPVVRADADALRAHERLLLTLVADTPNRLLSRVRAHPDLPCVLSVLTDDVVDRGWLHPAGHLLPAHLLDRTGRRRTSAGDDVARRLHAARADLRAHCPAPDTTAELLPVAVALGLLDLWTARLGQLRPPPASWFTPGPSTLSRGWLGVCGAATAMAAEPPPGGGAGSALLPPVGG